MDISTEKLGIIQRICEIQDNDLLDLIKNIVDSSSASKTDWWDKITLEEKESINRGLNDLEEGKVIPHDLVREKYEKWLN